MKKTLNFTLEYIISLEKKVFKLKALKSIKYKICSFFVLDNQLKSRYNETTNLLLPDSFPLIKEQFENFQSTDSIHKKNFCQLKKNFISFQAACELRLLSLTELLSLCEPLLTDLEMFDDFKQKIKHYAILEKTDKLLAFAIGKRINNYGVLIVEIANNLLINDLEDSYTNYIFEKIRYLSAHDDSRELEDIDLLDINSLLLLNKTRLNSLFLIVHLMFLDKKLSKINCNKSADAVKTILFQDKVFQLEFLLLTDIFNAFESVYDENKKNLNVSERIDNLKKDALELLTSGPAAEPLVLAAQSLVGNHNFYLLEENFDFCLMEIDIFLTLFETPTRYSEQQKDLILSLKNFAVPLSEIESILTFLDEAKKNL